MANIQRQTAYDLPMNTAIEAKEANEANEVKASTL
jgi:hypothetical protein